MPAAVVRSWLASVAAGVLSWAAVLLSAHALGLNRWLELRTTRLWNLPGYLICFPLFMLVTNTLILAWSSGRLARLLPTAIAGVLNGHVTGIVAYVLAPLFAGWSFSKLLAAIDFAGWAFIPTAIMFPFLLLGWLYGGTMCVFGLAIRRSLARITRSPTPFETKR